MIWYEPQRVGRAAAATTQDNDISAQDQQLMGEKEKEWFISLPPSVSAIHLPPPVP